MTSYVDQIGSQKGRTAIVTGANVGLGFETAKALALKDMHVVLACRNQTKAEKAIDRISKVYTTASLEFMELDLSKQQSVKQFSTTFLRKHKHLNLLINNAGIFLPPYTLTEDGFESQLAVNYLGHFTLTGLLMEILQKTKGSRVVSLSSLAHDWGDIYFDDLNFKRGYDRRKGYSQSKLACLMFAYELQRKLDDQGFQVRSLAAHPGVSITNLGRHLPSIANALGKLVQPLIFQPPNKAAEPILMAALEPEAKGGEYYGPKGFRQFRGKPGKVGSNRNSRDPEKAKKLWKVSEELTGTVYF